MQLGLRPYEGLEIMYVKAGLGCQGMVEKSIYWEKLVLKGLE